MVILILIMIWYIGIGIDVEIVSETFKSLIRYWLAFLKIIDIGIDKKENTITVDI